MEKGEIAQIRKNKSIFTVEDSLCTPKPAQLKELILEMLADNEIWRFMEIVEGLANRLNLTDADRERERFPGANDRLTHYCSHALRGLKAKDHLVGNPARGSWKIKLLGE